MITSSRTPKVFNRALQDENNTVIEVKNLVKNYGGLKAVDGVSFCIGRGEALQVSQAKGSVFEIPC